MRQPAFSLLLVFIIILFLSNALLMWWHQTSLFCDIASMRERYYAQLKIADEVFKAGVQVGKKHFDQIVRSQVKSENKEGIIMQSDCSELIKEYIQKQNKDSLFAGINLNKIKGMYQLIKPQSNAGNKRRGTLKNKNEKIIIEASITLDIDETCRQKAFLTRSKKEGGDGKAGYQFTIESFTLSPTV